MDKSWMLQYHNRFSQPYIDGVNSFIEFAKATSGGSIEIKCPCNYCCNGFKHDYETVRDHLLRRGMMVSYDTWLQHGELAQSDESDYSEEELVRVTAEQSQPSITSPLTDEQISVKVLGQRSGYLKGFGIRTKSTLGSTQNRTGLDSEVLQLRQQVAEFGKRISFLEGLVLQLAERAGIDPVSFVGGDGTSGGTQDSTSPGGTGPSPAWAGYDAPRGPGYDAQRAPSYDAARGHGYDAARGVGYDAARGTGYKALPRGATGPQVQVPSGNAVPYGSSQTSPHAGGNAVSHGMSQTPTRAGGGNAVPYGSSQTPTHAGGNAVPYGSSQTTASHPGGGYEFSQTGASAARRGA